VIVWEAALLLENTIHVAEDEFAVIAAEVHATAEAVAPPLTVGAFRIGGLHPGAVAVRLETVLPDVDEVVCIDVALIIIGPYAAASRDRAVDSDRGDGEAGLAAEEMVTNLALVSAEEALAAVAGVNATLFAGLRDEVHETTETLRRELEVRVLGRAAYREDCEETPVLQAERDEVLFELIERLVVAVVDAGDHVEGDGRLMGEDFNRLGSILEAVRTAAHPVMVRLETIEADGEGMDSGAEEVVDHLRGHEAAVGDHAPWEFEVIDTAAVLDDVRADERLAAGDDDHDLMRVVLLLDAEEDLLEVLEWHVRMHIRDLAVATAVTAGVVAPQRGLPEKLTQRMLFCTLCDKLTVELEGEPLSDGQLRHEQLFVLYLSVLTVRDAVEDSDDPRILPLQHGIKLHRRHLVLRFLGRGASRSLMCC